MVSQNMSVADDAAIIIDQRMTSREVTAMVNSVDNG